MVSRLSLSFFITNDHFTWLSSNECFLIFRFNSRQNQARWSLVLRKNEEVLAYSQCLRGNLPLSDAKFDAVVKFYCEDSISRMSSNAKDTILISKQPVSVRFMEMTILDAYRIFNERHPGAVARSTFYSLRPREVKIASSHETCMCVIHENMDLLLKVCTYCNSINPLLIFVHDRLGTTIIKNILIKLLQETMTSSI